MIQVHVSKGYIYCLNLFYIITITYVSNIILWVKYVLGPCKIKTFKFNPYLILIDFLVLKKKFCTQY